MASTKTSPLSVLPHTTPSPRLLQTVVREVTDSSERTLVEPTALRSSSLFSGNGMSIFIGIFAGAGLLAVAGYVYGQFQDQKRAATAAKLLGVVTETLSSSPNAVVPPAPLMVQIDSSHIRVSAISLGLPRLAIINGKQVAEGDVVTLHTPTAAITVNLRVVKIADGRVDLSDGMQIISVRVTVADAKLRKSGP